MQELAEDAGHAVVAAEQSDGGLEQLRPGQAAVAAVGLRVTAELPRHPNPLGPCGAWQRHAPPSRPSRSPVASGTD